MDLASKKLPIILIVVLIGVLVVQILTNDSDGRFIDPETCEIYIQDSQINSKKYIGEFDQKCLDFKNLNK